TFLVLLDRKSPPTNDIRNWLTDNGLCAWLANDVSHAIEELSDFTVRKRPDVVLLEVKFLADSMELLRSALQMPACANDVTVMGFEDIASSKIDLAADGLDRLSSVLDRRTATYTGNY